MTPDITEEEYAAIIILRSTGISAIEAALIAKEALKKGRGRVQRARKCLTLGEAELQKQEKTVTFRKAVEEALKKRQERRPRTLIDFRYFTNRFMRICTGLSERRMRSIRTEECAAWLELAFPSPHQRRKARAIMSGVFNTAIRNGWCDRNPVARVEPVRITEKQMSILTPQEIQDLQNTAKKYRNGICEAAVGLMLFAGIRPHEVARLTWAQIDFQKRAVYILPRHSKTGGARQVTIHKPLQRILRARRREDAETICPPNWIHHWQELRRTAGWGKKKPWPQDVLRHTFASYHLSYFRNFAELQLEIGHRDATLLRTRYIDQRGVHSADRFWNSIE